MHDKMIYTDLVDICDVSVDKNLSKEERIIEYVRQIKNPYRYRCGKFIINAKFNEKGPSLEDCLKMIIDLDKSNFTNEVVNQA